MVTSKYYIYSMEIQHTETNRGNKAIIVDGYVYRKTNVLKNGNVVYTCSVSKNCKKTVITDEGGDSIVKVIEISTAAKQNLVLKRQKRGNSECVSENSVENLM